MTHSGMIKHGYNSLQYNRLQKLLLGRNLTSIETRHFFSDCLDSAVSTSEARTILLLLREKVETAAEINGAARALRDRCSSLSVRLPHLVDNCGTGGDGKHSFNVSTIAALVAAGAGAHVAKHGNRSISSKVGSSDLLESLGVNINAKPERMLEALKTAHIGYFHAPLYHPAMRALLQVRKSIFGRTVMNLLGPLVNPLQVKRQVIGVPAPRFLLPVAQALRLSGTKRAYVICGENGMDELTPYGRSRGYEVSAKGLRPFSIRVRRLHMSGKESDLRGGTLRQNRRIALALLTGEIQGAKRNAVILNAGLALLASGLAADLWQGVEMACISLDSGKAHQALQRLAEISQK